MFKKIEHVIFDTSNDGLVYQIDVKTGLVMASKLFNTEDFIEGEFILVKINAHKTYFVLHMYYTVLLRNILRELLLHLFKHGYHL